MWLWRIVLVGSEDGLFSDSEKDEVLLLATTKDVPAPVPISGSILDTLCL